MKEHFISKNNYFRLLQYTLYGGVLLYLGRSILVPVAYAVFISFILFPVSKWLESRKVPRPLAIMMSLLILIILFGGIVWLLLGQAFEFASQWKNLQPRINATIDDFMNYLHTRMHISVQQTDKWLDQLINKGGAEVFTVAGSTLYFSAVSAVNIFLTAVYAVLILYNRRQLVSFIFSLFPATGKAEIVSILREVIYTFYHFIKGMLTVYLTVGALNCIGLYLLGVPNAILFGFIASILTFIPYVGILIGSLLPVTIAWAVHDNFFYAIGVVGVFTLVQVLEANLIFPIAVSHRLKVSTLFTIISIFTGGIIWGLSGMILFIPALGITKLIIDKLPRYKNISALLEG